MKVEELNKVHNMDFLNNSLPDKCANLIIADPPYYKVKGDFDFIWKTFDYYLADVEKWAIECKRLLADNGTLFWYGNAKNIAYAQIIFDKNFNLINNLVWNKGSFMGLEESEGLRSFAPCTERILMYGNKLDDKMFDDFYHDTVRKSIEPTHKYLNSLITRNELAEKLLNIGNCKNIASAKQNANNILKQTSAKPQFITEFQYNLIDSDKKPYEELRREYEELRREYEELRRPFNNLFKLQEVLNFSNEQCATGAKYDHDTVKPESLTRALILTCSRENDLVIVPFAGSGTECAMSVKEKRNFIGYEITPKHAKMAQERADKILKEPTLF
jgi:site-specific DNA-methyltransferase (adenine-specific)